jgi:hypothetical protein
VWLVEAGMYTLFLTMFLSGTIGAHRMTPQGAEQPREVHCEQQTAPVILIVDGSSEWSGQVATRIAGELNASLGSCRPLEVARFDADPALQTGFAVEGLDRDLVTVKPRISMREAMEAGFLRLIDAPGPHTMVVIGHEQFCPTSVSQGRLLKLARHTKTTVHTIHLASTPTRSGVFTRLGRSLRNGAVGAVELSLGERGYSPRDTARLLKVMADATGGKACVTTEQPAEIDCAHAVAGEILGPPRLAQLQ